MSKRCAKCEKIVYPTEELKCLDKTWHKACFRCTECSMALNMKNYKGYNKKPYCNAHYPTTKHTQVAETPEMARLAQNTRLQSNIQYHGEYEKAKGKCTSIADDPETKRILQNTQKISTITYTGQHEKDRGKYTSIVDDSEIQRLVKNSEKFSLAKYHEDFERNIKGSKIQVSDDPETLRHKANTSVVSNVEYTAKDRYQDGDQPRHSRVMGVPTGLPRAPASNGSVGMRKNPTYPLPSEPSVASPYSDRSQGHSTAYTTDGKVEQQGKGRVGSIHDFDPLNENFGSLNSGYNPNMPPRQGSMSQGQQQWEETVTINQMPQKAPAEPTTPPPPHHSEPEHHYPAPQPVSQPQPSYQPAMPPAQAPVHHPPQPVQPPPNPEPPAPQAPPQTTNPMTSAVFQAMYDYDAQDDDEISFIDGDLLIECQQIDDGWMFGTVRRTGARGMLPANYVERVQ